MLTQRIIGTTVTVAEERPRSSVAKVNLTPATISKTGSVSVGPFAWFVVAYNIAVILWGAYVRVSGSGAGCGSLWPLCNGEILPSGTQSQTLIEFVHRVTSALSLVIVSFLVVWCWRRTSKGDWARYSSVCGLFLLFNEALLGALLVLSDHVGLDPSAAHALFLCLHFGNTLLLLAALTLTARWLSNRERRFVVVRKPHEPMAIGLGLVSVMAIGMTGSLASLGDTIFPVGSLRRALMQDFSSTSHVLLRLRLLHPVAAAIGSLPVRVVLALEPSGEATLVGLEARPWGHINGADRSRPYERHLVGSVPATDDTSARGRAVLDPARTCLSRAVACRATVEWSCPRTDERGQLGCVEAYAAYTVVAYGSL
jgi:heme a synthase